MLYLLYVWLFVFGLGLGSFLNVAASRYRPGGRPFDFRYLGGRSRCPHCEAVLTWKELLPLLSFLIQRGKCRSCGGAISFRYPLIELLSGFIVLAVPVHLMKNYGVGGLSLSGESVVWYYFFSAIWVTAFLTLLLLAVIDFYHYLIPDGLNAFLGFLGVFLVGGQYYFGRFDELTGSFLGHYAAVFGLRENVFINHAAAAALAALFFGLVILFTRGRGMGMGDLKLGAALGLLFGWPDIVLILVLSFVAGAALSLALMAAGRKGRKDFVPFGPFLVLGSALVFFFGYPIVQWYFQLFNLPLL